MESGKTVSNMEKDYIKDLMEQKGKECGKMGKSFNGFDNLFILKLNNYKNFVSMAIFFLIRIPKN